MGEGTEHALQPFSRSASVKKGEVVLSARRIIPMIRSKIA